MNAQILAALLKAAEQNPQGILQVLQLVLDIFKNNPTLLTELLGMFKARS